MEILGKIWFTSAIISCLIIVGTGLIDETIINKTVKGLLAVFVFLTLIAGFGLMIFLIWRI